jgi:thioredoxin reductase (NADPH)
VEILLHRTGVRGEFFAGKGIGYLDDGTKIIARASVCATGVEYRRLNLPNEDRLLGAVPGQARPRSAATST